jgi:hypothetical protein
MLQRLSQLMASHARSTFRGRQGELAVLARALAPDGPRVVFVYGIAGIGKSSLLGAFAEHARRQGARLVCLDCRTIEPTEAGFLHELMQAVGEGITSVEEAAARLGSLGERVVLCVDTYEVFRLMDAWLRQRFIPLLPQNARVLFFGRERPLAAWRAVPGAHELFEFMALGPMNEMDAVELLGESGLARDVASRVAHAVHSHPLALRLAASAQREHLDLVFEDATLQQVLNELTRMFLADVQDPLSRRVLEGASVIRRATVPLLAALFPELAPQAAYERLRDLPFVDAARDGLIVHEVVRESIAHSLRASDPPRYVGYQRAAWQCLAEESARAARQELWRYTADMLYLVENPVVREAFFPCGAAQLAVEPARPEDSDGLRAIVLRHEGPAAAATLLEWWRRLPQAFSVIRGRDARVTGLLCKFEPHRIPPAWVLEDPATREWRRHLDRSPLPTGQTALFCRRWLSMDEGEAPSEAQAAAWLDLKRTYMELRPALRRVYLTVRDLGKYASAAQRLGFTVMTGQELVMDGVTYYSAFLDFGPASVDGWLAGLAAAELGIDQQIFNVLDVEARQLVLDERRVALTRLELGVMNCLVSRRGKAVSRAELLRDVWDTSYQGGSNVVDTVIRALRRKLGRHAQRIETVSGIGYRWH